MDLLKNFEFENTYSLVGLDIGSTTAKLVVIRDKRIIFKKYERHFSQVRSKALQLMKEAEEILKDQPFYIAVSGSAGLGLAKSAELLFVQEVFANAQLVEQLEPDADVVVELGGEDAKIIFFKGGIDERMNGSCAGGTGAFIDQMATLLSLSVDELDELSLKAEKIYPIASRCGVFAKSDIQPLLNQGARKEDIAASIYQAVVDQTVAGLAQGRKIEGRVMFLGGPLYYCEGLRRRFKESLGLDGSQAIFPEYGRFSVALGAAFYAAGQNALCSYADLINRIEKAAATKPSLTGKEPLFRDKSDYEAFLRRHQRADVERTDISSYRGKAYLGIDCGSTTTKLVLITEDASLLYSYYGNNHGDPVDVVRGELIKIYSYIQDSFLPNDASTRVTIAGAAVTGYGEELIKKAFHIDGGIVETMAHYNAAKFFDPEVDFIIDIGGQDMKCLSVKNDSIDSIILNEACSSGCGSFIESFAKALGYSIADFAELGLFAKRPVDLGSRCTVFMNSSVKQAQKDGADISDISAGLSMSIVKNALYKVLRVRSADELGKHIVVQGGTFLNDAVLRCLERELCGEVVRPEIAELMGAFGAALFARSLRLEASGIISAQKLSEFTHISKTVSCNSCTNHCSLTVNTFFGNEKFVSGNKCEKGALAAAGSAERYRPLPNLYRYKRELLLKLKEDEGEGRFCVGLPMSLGMLELAPLWHTVFRELGFKVIMTGFSDKSLYAAGQYTIPSDTACYPAKLMHGHIMSLIDKKADIIFCPCLSYNIDEGEGDNHYNCPVVAYYPEVLNANMGLLKSSVSFLYPYLSVNNEKKLADGIAEAFADYGVVRATARAAVCKGLEAYASYMRDIKDEGMRALVSARAEGRKIIILCGRPYHVDSGICQGMDQLIESLGFAVVSEDCVADLVEPAGVNVINQWTYHARLYNAAKYAALHDDCQLVQLVSFGCGLDAITTDEVREILENNGKFYTQIKIDEISNPGAARIRLRSLMGAMEELEKRRKA